MIMLIDGRLVQFVVVFGNNTASNISKLSKISRAASASDIWTILKYYKPVLFPNTTYKSCYYLFIIQGKSNPTRVLKTYGDRSSSTDVIKASF